MSIGPRQDREENEGEGEEGSPPAKRPRSSCGLDDKQTDIIQEFVRMLQKQYERIENVLRENQLELQEKFSSLTAAISGVGGYHPQFLDFLPPRVLSYQNCSGRLLRLQFVNSCSKDKYSTHKIEADDESPLQVAIYDHNNRIVTSEPFSSMRVQIVVINGDFDHDHRGQWTKKDFDTKIVHGRPQKGQLLSGELKFRLQNGVGYLSSAKFQDNSSFVPSKKFKLGVMAADERISERIQEGITESFAVKDVRGYIAKKNPNPSPRDAVYKLSKIAKSGDRHKLLEQNGIKTVEDFLSFYQKSPGDLRKILGKISDQDWDLIIGHAQKCNPRPGVYSSFLQESNVSHEHQALFGSNGRYYLQGSCSMHPSHMLQAQLDVQGTQQQISSEYNGLSSGGLPVTVPNSSNFQPETLYQNLMQHGQLEGTQVVGQQVSSVGNEVLPASSLDVSSSQQQQHSLECNRTPDQLDGNGLSHVNLSDWQPLQELWLDGHVDTQWDSSGNALSASAEGLVNEFTGWRQPSIPVTPGSGGSCSAAEQNYWGHSPVSEAGSISYNGISAVSEAAGNRSHGHRGLSPSPSPARGAAGSRRHRALSFSPARGAGNVRRRALSFSPGRGARSSSNGWPPLPPGPPSWWTDNTSNTSADCTDEEYCLDG